MWCDLVCTTLLCSDTLSKLCFSLPLLFNKIKTSKIFNSFFKIIFFSFPSSFFPPLSISFGLLVVVVVSFLVYMFLFLFSFLSSFSLWVTWRSAQWCLLFHRHVSPHPSFYHHRCWSRFVFWWVDGRGECWRRRRWCAIRNHHSTLSLHFFECLCPGRST